MERRDAGGPLGVGEQELAQRVAAVDVQPAGRGERASDAGHRALTRLGVAAVERSDAHCEAEVVRRLAGLEREVLGGGAAHRAWRMGAGIRSA